MFGFILVIALTAAFLEATLLPTLKIAGGMIELATITMTAIMFFGSLRYSSVFLIFSTIFLSIFTQMPPIYFLLPNFVILAILVFLISRRILAKPGTLPSFFLFFAAVSITDLIKLVIFWNFSLSSLYAILPDAIYSATAATIIYFIANRIFLYFNPQMMREKIKVM